MAPPSSSEAKNLATIVAALDDHQGRCGWPATAIRLNPFEVDRLGWDEIRGVPVEPDASLPTGRIRIVCDREPDLAEAAERADGRELVVAAGCDAIEWTAPHVRLRYRRGF